MNKNRLIVLVVLLFALAAVFSVVYLKEKPRTGNQVMSLTAEGKVKRLDGAKVILAMNVPNAFGTMDELERAVVYNPEKTVIYKKVEASGASTFQPISFAQIKTGMTIVVYSDIDTRSNPEFTANRIEVIK